MEQDLVERLRKFHAEIVASDGGESGQMAMTREAADEIERLRTERWQILSGLVEVIDSADELLASFGDEPGVAPARAKLAAARVALSQ